MPFHKPPYPYEVFLEFRRHDLREDAWDRLLAYEGRQGIESVNRLDFAEGYIRLEADHGTAARCTVWGILQRCGLAAVANVTAVHPVPYQPEEA